MLVQNWLADPGAVGDVVHGGGVVPLHDEHLAGSDEQLCRRSSRGSRGPRSRVSGVVTV